MFNEINNIISTDIHEIQRIFACYKESSACSLRENPHDHYRVDRHSAIGYFGIISKWKKKVFDYFSELQGANKNFAYIDICGRASGKKLGATVSYLFSLKTDDFVKSILNRGDVYVDGDIFNPSDFSRLLGLVKKGGIPPAFVTFMPMAGLQGYTPLVSVKDIPNYEALTYLYLSKRLKEIVTILMPGGYILLERPFQLDGSMIQAMQGIPQHKFRLSLAIKKIVRKLKCRVEILSEIGGPYFLIHKPDRS